MNPDPEELAAWLRMRDALPIEAWHRLLGQWDDPRALIDAPRALLARDLDADSIARLKRPPSSSQAQKIEAACAWTALAGHHCITLADERYPRAMLEVTHTPALFFAQGPIETLELDAVALCLPRQPSREGWLNARQFARALVNGGQAVVCPAGAGFAEVDEWFGRDWPRAVVIAGALPAPALSAPSIKSAAAPLWLALDAPQVPERAARSAHTLAISLARRIVVVEAALGSAPLATARAALDCGREVMAIPGSIHSPLSKGCHRLIRDGTQLVETIDDVLDPIARRHTRRT